MVTVMNSKKVKACYLLLAAALVSLDASVYYISPSGDDANDGSASMPWKTIKRSESVLRAGDTALVRGGTYPKDRFWPYFSGRADAPVVLKAYPGEKPVLTDSGSWDVHIFIGWQAKEYVVIDSICSDSTFGYVIQLMGARCCVIKNCEFRNNNATTILVTNSNKNRILNNYFNTTGDPSNEGAGNHIYVEGSDSNLIKGNYFTRAGHCAVDLIDYSNLAGTSNVNIIMGNTIEQHWGSGIGLIRQSARNLVQDNRCYFIGEGVVAYPKSGIMAVSDSNIVRRNIIAKTSVSPVADNAFTFEAYTFNGHPQHSRYNRVYGNVIYKSGGEPIFVTQRDASVCAQNKFFNNIVYNNRMAGRSETWIDPDANYYIIFETYHANQDNKWPYFANNNFFYHNLFLHVDSASGLEKPGENPLFYYDAFNNGNGWGASLTKIQDTFPSVFWGNVETSPMFTDAERGDFTLRLNSGAIDAGAFLARTVSAGSGATIPVDDALPFCDGWGIIDGDSIRIGDQKAMVIATDYAARTLTVSSAMTFGDSAGVGLVYTGSAPDMGAFEFGMTSAIVNRIADNSAQKPNRWKPDVRQDFGELVFKNIAPGSTIRLFSIDGRSIRRVSARESAISIPFDKMTAGLYVYSIEDGKSRHSGAVISHSR
jgi:parallel beta-helix repeat protein